VYLASEVSSDIIWSLSVQKSRGQSEIGFGMDNIDPFIGMK